MKRAKLALSAVAVLAVVGGALAFKSTTGTSNFFGYTTSLINNQVTGVCTVLKALPYDPNPAGAIVTPYSSAQTLGVTTCQATVVPRI